MLTDRQLQESVQDELAWEPSITAAHIGVTAKDGIVTLTGHVETYPEKHAAEQAATRVKGVRAVAEGMEVRLAYSTIHDDADIARAAADRLKWEAMVPKDHVLVKVENGWVTLSGEVDWHFQRDAAYRVIHSLLGVIGVSNNLTIKSRVNTANIANDINMALHRGWYDPRTILVTANGGKIKLTGTVNTPGERWTAGSTAWGAPGTTSVENDLIVV